MVSNKNRLPALFINHGGGPLPLMGKQPDLAKHMKEVVATKLSSKPKPKSIVVFSAHWEADPISITSSKQPSLYFDYYGFPDETYRYTYPAPGNPELARRIQGLLLKDAGIASRLDDKRGYDHGVFVPLKLMYPKADIPVVVVSLHPSMDVDMHLALGKALAPLRDENVLLLGSGYTFHNMRAMFDSSKSKRESNMQKARAFNEWLKHTMQPTTSTTTTSTSSSRMEAIKKWKEDAPYARFVHPKEEHLMPLFVITAAAAGEDDDDDKTELIYENDHKKNHSDYPVSGYMFG